MQTLKLQLLERLKPLNEVLSVISKLLWLIVFVLISYVASIYVYNQFQNTSSGSCSLNFSNHDCYHKLIQKIYKAKHFILIQQPNMLKGNAMEKMFSMH
jgi:beta-lactamase regulating signal transducer with metallopeptidase domain